jgi:hypothetical protein
MQGEGGWETMSMEPGMAGFRDLGLGPKDSRCEQEDRPLNDLADYQGEAR